MTHWSVAREDDVCILTFDKTDSSQNVLSLEALTQLDQAVNEITAMSPRGLIIASGKDNGFIAGADVKEFAQVQSREQALDYIRKAHGILDRIEQFRFPTVAMINGHCLGGGLELALACDYRVSIDDPSTRLGLPEVMLGIHPGFGGTVRMIETCGVPGAMDLMLSGRTVVPKVAKKMGFVDLAVPLRQLRRAADHMINKQPAKSRAKGWKSWVNAGPGRMAMAPMLEKQVARKAKRDHYPAPYAIIDLWKSHGGDRQAMLKAEQSSAADLVLTDTSRNLVRVFFLQELLKSLGKSEDAKEPATHVHVIGAGVMGGDIAAWCTLRGLNVTIQDQNPDALARASQRAHTLFKRKLRDSRRVRLAMDRFQPDLRGDGVKVADVIIEAIFENAEAKMNLFADLEKKARPDAILASNTSSIPLETLCNALSKPGRLVGLHFFNPVAKMRLVEIVNGEKTFSQVSKRAAAFAQQINRLPLPVKSSPGFLVNRILMPYLMEAVELHKEGVPNAVIDKVATDFGMPMGPITLADTVGLDICQHVASNLNESFGGEMPEVLVRKVESGKLGKKTGEGFYVWKKGKPEKEKAPKDYQPPADLEDRLIFRFLNETVACLQEGIVDGNNLADGGLIFGTGFAPFRGGPVHYISGSGQEAMLKKLEALHEKYGDRFAPNPGWSSLDLTTAIPGVEGTGDESQR